MHAPIDCSNSHAELQPSLYNLEAIRHQISLKQKGLQILMRNRDKMETTLNKQRHMLRDNLQDLVRLMRHALHALSTTNFFATELRAAKLMEHGPSNFELLLVDTRLAGVYVPKFRLVESLEPSYPLLGLGRGGEKVAVTRKAFQDVVRVFVKTANQVGGAGALMMAMAENSKRISTIENVEIPRLRGTVCHMNQVLDERERDYYFRLKVSQAKIARNRAEFTELVQQKALNPANSYFVPRHFEPRLMPLGVVPHKYEELALHKKKKVENAENDSEESAESEDNEDNEDSETDETDAAEIEV